MANEKHEHTWVLKGEFDNLSRALSDVQGQLKTMEAQTVKNEKEIEKLRARFKKTGDGAEESGLKIGNLRKSIASIGGPTATAGARVLNLAEGFGSIASSAGPAGAAIAIAATAVVGFGYAAKTAIGLIVGIAEATDQANDRISALGLVTAEEASQADELGDAVRNLNHQWDAFMVRLGSGASGELKTFIDALAGALSLSIEWKHAMDDLRAEIEDLTGPLEKINPLFAVFATLTRRGESLRLAEQQKVLRGEIDETGKAIKKTTKEVDGISAPVPKVEHLSKAVAAAKREAQEAEKAYTAWTAATGALTDAIVEANDDLLSDEDRVHAAFLKRVEDIDAQEAKLVESGMTIEDAMAQTAANRLAAEERLTRDLAALRKEQSDDATSKAKDTADAVRSIRDTMTADLMDEADEARAAHDDRVADIRALGLSEDQTNALILESKERLNRDLKALDEERVEAAKQAQAELVEAAFGAAQEIASSIVSILQEQIDAQVEAIEAAQDRLQENIDTARDEYEESRDRHQQQLDDLNERLANEQFLWGAEREAVEAQRQTVEDLMASEEQQFKDDQKRRRQRLRDKNEEMAEVQRQAVRAFRIEQGSAIADVAFNLAQAYSALLAVFAPLGPGAPAAAGAITVPVGIAQVAAIMAQQPPKFHDGGVLDPDESMFSGIKVRANEAAVVFNERAVQQGAVDDAMAANRGTSGRQQVAMVNNAGRAIARLWLDELGDPTSELSRAIGSTEGIKSVYGRAA